MHKRSLARELFTWGPVALLLAGATWGGRLSAAEPAPPVADRLQFNRDIRPILSDSCFECHGPGEQTAGVRLDTAEGATDWAIVPGDAELSEVITRVTADDPDLRMPPVDSKKPALTAEQVAVLRRWIDEGAEYEAHWAYINPERPEPPRVSRGEWVQSPIDRFVLARLDGAGLSPAPEADRVTLVRRLYLDVTGLPPTVAQVDAFLLDNRPDAYERLVDALLASPRYAERMATWWFDLIRFANTVGYHGDQDHSITPYRDYVLKAFDENLPFDQFTIEQLAGDLLPPTGDRAVDLWRLVATGYNRVLMTSHEGGIQDKEYRAKMLADRVRNVSEVWLGSSMGCCQCHDHKYDPFTIRDFYTMAAFFADVDHHGSFVSISQNTLPAYRPPEVLAWTLPVFRELQEIEPRIAELEEKLSGPLPRDYAKLQGELATLEQRRAGLEAKRQATLVTIATEPQVVRVLPRGDWMDDSGEVVEPSLPEFLAPPGAAGERLTRLDLARWLVAEPNPLTARVVANRLWKLYFGAGLSSVLIDVGSQGRPPSHPELLDWLAVDLRENGWDLKRFIRQILVSSAYRQSSLAPPALAEADPENRLLARQGRFRLDAEPIRDSALLAAGLLRNQLGGVVAKPYQPSGYYAQLNFPARTYQASRDDDQYRRGVYTHWQRQYLHPWLLAFDAPSREECTANRAASNTPSAALVLLNDPSFVEAARGLATRTLMDQKDGEAASDGDRVRWMWRVATGRQPRTDETGPLLDLLASQREFFGADPKAADRLTAIGMSPRPKGVKVDELAAWTSVARVLMNLNEFITRN